MTKINKRTKHIAVATSLLILLAMTLRITTWVIPVAPTVGLITGFLRSSIYIGLFAVWGISVRQRIIQTQVRRYLTAVSILMVFWVLVRTVKYQFFTDTHLGRYCWYLYYLPMLFIPLLLLFVALSLGKPENFRLPKWANYLLCVSATLLLLVLTNDFHQLAFKFPNGLIFFNNSDYSHELIYFLSIGWMALCAVTAFIFMVAKSHVPGSKKRILLPCIPLITIIVYITLYLLAFDCIALIAGDMTVVSCLLTSAALESCIQCGLIQSNTHYKELFRLSGVRAQLADNNYNILFSSADTEPLSKEIMQKTETAPVFIDSNIRLSGAPIRGGHVMWFDDVSELSAALEELAEKREDLKEENSLLRENYKTEQRIHQLAEKNRLYDEIHRQTAQQITLLGNLISQFEKAQDEAQRKRLLQKMAVVGVYLKRRSNLIFISEQSQRLHTTELSLCFAETMDNLKLSGVDCGCYIAFEHELPAKTAMAFYDFYERVIEASYNGLRSILIRIFENGDCTAISLDVSCEADLSSLQSESVSVSYDKDEGYSLVLRVPKGGTE